MGERAQLPPDVQRLFPLTPAVFLILLSLADGEKHGYAIMQSANLLSDGKFRMLPGTLYTTIQRLLDLALVEETAGPRGSAELDTRRRYYRLTSMGKLALETEVDRMESLVRVARQKKLRHRTAE